MIGFGDFGLHRLIVKSSLHLVPRPSPRVFLFLVLGERCVVYLKMKYKLGVSPSLPLAFCVEIEGKL